MEAKQNHKFFCKVKKKGNVGWNNIEKNSIWEKGGLKLLPLLIHTDLYPDCDFTWRTSCCYCLPCNHCSNWTWVVEEMLAFWY